MRGLNSPYQLTCRNHPAFEDVSKEYPMIEVYILLPLVIAALTAFAYLHTGRQER